MEVSDDIQVVYMDNKLYDFNDRSEYQISGEKLDEYCHIIDETIDGYVEENSDVEYTVSKKDIEDRTDLSSFRPRKELNPKLWNGDTLKSEVRLHLLDIADDFFDSLEVDWVKPKDIILTGSLANYNWSEYSDYDLHILLDFDDVDDRTDFVKDYFDSKKNEWNETHDNLNIYGYPVEVYVQDVNEEHDASGIYSLEKNEWLRKPEENGIKAIKLDKFWIKEKTLKYMRKIDSMEHALDSTDDKHVQEEISDSIDKLFDHLKEMRSDSLKRHGEMAPGNIIYKLLRRTGYLDKIFGIKSSVYDKINSL